MGRFYNLYDITLVHFLAINHTCIHTQHSTCHSILQHVINLARCTAAVK